MLPKKKKKKKKKKKQFSHDSIFLRDSQSCPLYSNMVQLLLKQVQTCTTDQELSTSMTSDTAGGHCASPSAALAASTVGSMK